ncbi:sperm-associated antigen 17 [Lampris incognitus]|uniref:sperm-associated antigen 17 n=1 Tax=Lampris incognitus TaxID=2546036 RepID=UPI0024B6269A|nr:sperm-associated antigen 17 [Lampris incognitus]
MPPKQVKGGNDAPGAPKIWESGLTAARLEEDSWRACVTMVIGKNPEDENLIEALEVAVLQPQRKLFTLLTLDSTKAKIQEYGNPKTKKPKDAPMFYEVMEPAKVLLDAGEEIPCDLMAKILKFQLLEIKASNQCRRGEYQAAEVKAKDKARSASAARDKRGAKSLDDKAKKGPAPGSPIKDKDKDKEKGKERAKEKETKLKKRRGEESELPNFIDDEPDDGPQQYVLLVGFHHPQLLGALEALGVHVANVIQLGSEHTTHTLDAETQEDEQTLSEPNQTRPSDVDEVPVSSTQEEEVDHTQELAERAKKLEMFWSGLKPVLDRGPPFSKLQDVARLSYYVPDPPQFIHRQDHKFMLELGSRIFDGVASLIYDCLDWRQQHQHYRDSIRLINIPTVLRVEPCPVVPTEVVQSPVPAIPGTKKKPAREDSPQIPSQAEVKPCPLSTDVDMRYYGSLLDLVPPESCSVPLILHCMLEQVVVSKEKCHASMSMAAEETSTSFGPGMDHQLASYMLHSFLPLVRTEQEKSHIVDSFLTLIQDQQDRQKLAEEFGPKQTQQKTDAQCPLVFKHHDERALRLRQIIVRQGFDPAEVESSMMKLSQVWKLIHSPPSQRNSDPHRMARKQQLLRYCAQSGVAWREVDHMFQQSVLESMPLAGVDQHGLLMSTMGPLGTTPAPARQETPLPWDDPLSYAKHQLNNQQSRGQTFLTDPPGSPKDKNMTAQLEFSEIQSNRQRFLSGWHYTEHHNASVFPQVLLSACEVYSCMDTFQASHDNILYIFCHSPMSPQRQSKEFWEMALHTDVGFRNYLEHVADAISDWTKQEERKREAEKVKILSPAESLKGDTNGDSSPEVSTPEPIIRKDSLKAWKLEQELLKEEEIAKRSKKDSASGGKQQRGKDEQAASTAGEKDNKKPSAGSRKSREAITGGSSKSPIESITNTLSAVEGDEELQPAEKSFSGFLGYSMNGRLIQVSGGIQNLFPSDGGQITVENINYVQGSSLLKVGVRKDGHHFYTHINHVVVEPVKTAPPPGEKETKYQTKDAKDQVETKVVRQGSFSAVLDNGIHLSYSYYGPTGQYTASSPVPEGEALVKNRVSPLPVPISDPTSNHATKGPSLASSLPQNQEPDYAQKCEALPVQLSCPFNSLNLSIPNGLLLQFLTEDTQGTCSKKRSMLVRQSFPLHGGDAGGALQDPLLSRELSRVITSHGAVVKHMRDGSTEVLFPDGSVSFSPDSGPVWVPDSEVEEEKTPPPIPKETQDNKRGKSAKKEAEPQFVPTPQRGCWSTTTPSGTRISTVGNTHKHTPSTRLLAYHATDPYTKAVMLSREDHVVSVQGPDGTLTVEHSDRTRITSLHQDREAHTPLNTGDGSECVCVKSKSEYTSDRAEQMCMTCPAQNVLDDVYSELLTQGASDGGAQTGVVGTGSTSDDGAHSMLSVGEDSEEKELASVCGSDKAGGVQAKERVLLVEREDYATVIMYPERLSAHVFLADGTVVTATSHGTYQVFPSNTGLLQIQVDGTCVYLPDSAVTPTPESDSCSSQTGSYTMSHTGKVACDVTDPDGNHFQVMEDGQITAVVSSPAESTLVQEEVEDKDGEMTGLPEKHTERCPRLFVVHEDGSGTELLSCQTVEEVLSQAYSDPTIALLKEPLPDTQDEFAITILKPSHQSVWSQWLLQKQNPEIIPTNLRNRSWHNFPRIERKTSGPPFGTDLGPGLTIGDRSCGSLSQGQPARSCPEALELRELTQYRPVTTQLRNTLDWRLKEYMEHLLQREQLSEEMKIKDPRTEEERVHASDLLKLILSLPESECPDPTLNKRTSEDMASLYNKEVVDPVVHLDTSEDTPRGQSDRQELLEEKAHREAQRKKIIVPYFHPENAHLHLVRLAIQEPDMRSLSMDLPPFPKTDESKAFLRDAPQEEDGSDAMPPGRPTNPTPQTAVDNILRGSSGYSNSAQLDVTGKPRKTKINLPSSILGSKPCSIPNHQFLSVEEPVRRRCRTVSLRDPTTIRRGFQFLPSSVSFGTLKEGTSYAVTVVMKNVGVDNCRFSVKQLPPATGLRVIYKPGPVAAGLQVELQVQLYATSADKSGQIKQKSYVSHYIHIHTETDIFYLPVTATILPEKLYDIWVKDNINTGNKKGSRAQRLASIPPVRQKVVSSHKQIPPLTTLANPGEFPNPAASL